MRSSKKRSRSSQNRPRTLGNIINRVFDSSGPEGKVRGTPQQIIEKYQMLARDAQLSNDRVAAENFLQHAEHYTRMLAEATREMAAEQEARQQQYQQSGGQNGGQNGGQPSGNQGSGNQPSGNQGSGHQGSGGQPRNDRQGDGRDRSDRFERQDRGERRTDAPRDYRDDRDYPAAQPSVVDVIDLDSGQDSVLIETPESSPRPRAAIPAEAGPADAAPASPERSVARRPRGPRKPKVDGKPDGDPPQEAAE